MVSSSKAQLGSSTITHAVDGVLNADDCLVLAGRGMVLIFAFRVAITNRRYGCLSVFGAGMVLVADMRF